VLLRYRKSDSVIARDEERDKGEKRVIFRNSNFCGNIFRGQFASELSPFLFLLNKTNPIYALTSKRIKAEKQPERRREMLMSEQSLSL